MTITKREIYELIRSYKADIQDDYRAFEEDEVPGIQLTFGTDDGRSGYGFQSGDNCYSGGAYGFRHWAVIGVYRDSNCRKLTNDVFDQWAELMNQ